MNITRHMRNGALTSFICSIVTLFLVSMQLVNEEITYVTTDYIFKHYLNLVVYCVIVCFFLSLIEMGVTYGGMKLSNVKVKLAAFLSFIVGNCLITLIFRKSISGPLSLYNFSFYDYALHSILAIIFTVLVFEGLKRVLRLRKKTASAVTESTCDDVSKDS